MSRPLVAPFARGGSPGIGIALAAALVLAPGLAPGPTRAEAPAMPAVAFVAHVSHEVVRRQADGITRIERWEDLIARDGDTVWVERALPPALGAAGSNDDGHHQRHGHGHGHGHWHGHGHDHEHGEDEDSAAAAYRGHGHRHFNGDAAARWIERGHDGRLSLFLVDRRDRVVVSIPRAEFGTVGFDGRFDTAASLVPASVIATMAIDETVPPVTTPLAARWYSERRDGWVHRVLWAEAAELALAIDSRREDGSLTRSVRVELDAVPGPAGPVTAGSERASSPADARPWQALAGYEHRRYDEYLD